MLLQPFCYHPRASLQKALSVFGSNACLAKLDRRSVWSRLRRFFGCTKAVPLRKLRCRILDDPHVLPFCFVAHVTP